MQREQFVFADDGHVHAAANDGAVGLFGAVVVGFAALVAPGENTASAGVVGGGSALDYLLLATAGDLVGLDPDVVLLAEGVADLNGLLGAVVDVLVGVGTGAVVPIGVVADALHIGQLCQLAHRFQAYAVTYAGHDAGGVVKAQRVCVFGDLAEVVDNAVGAEVLHLGGEDGGHGMAVLFLKKLFAGGAAATENALVLGYFFGGNVRLVPEYSLAADLGNDIQPFLDEAAVIAAVEAGLEGVHLAVGVYHMAVGVVGQEVGDVAG